jgi:hypothetical protein
MSTNDRLTDATDPEETLGDLLTYAELLNTPQLARLYVYVLRNGPIAIKTVKDDLDVPHSTAYKHVGELEEMGILTRHDEETPTRITVDPIHLTIETDHGGVVATPVLVDAIGRQLNTEDIRVFVDRRGIPKLAAALHYTLRVMNGELTQRTATNKLDVHPVEGTTVITALQDVVEEATAYDPYLEPAE